MVWCPPGRSGRHPRGRSHPTRTPVRSAGRPEPRPIDYCLDQGLVRKIVGGVLSPLLANLLLDDWDRELERRGHRFCRYADDGNVYVQSRAAGGAGDGLVGAIPGRQAPSACQPGEERGGGGSGAQVPGLSTPGGRTRLGIAPQETFSGQRSYPADHPQEPRNPVSNGWSAKAEQLPHRLGDVFPPRGNAEPPPGCG